MPDIPMFNIPKHRLTAQLCNTAFVALCVALCVSASVAFHNAVAPHISLQLIRVARIALVALLLMRTSAPITPFRSLLGKPLDMLPNRTVHSPLNPPNQHASRPPHHRTLRYHLWMALVLLCASLVLSSVIGWLVAQWLPHTNHLNAAINGVYVPPLVSNAATAHLLFGAVLGAVDEELLFRVLCYRVWYATRHSANATRLPPTPATHPHKSTAFIVCSTALFTGAHIGLPLATLLHALGSSIVLSAFYAHHRSAPFTIVLHTTVNIIAIALYYVIAIAQ